MKEGRTEKKILNKKTFIQINFCKKVTHERSQIMLFKKKVNGITQLANFCNRYRLLGNDQLRYNYNGRRKVKQTKPKTKEKLSLFPIEDGRGW